MLALLLRVDLVALALVVGTLAWILNQGRRNRAAERRRGAHRCIFCGIQLPPPHGLPWWVFGLTPPPFCPDYEACKSRWRSRILGLGYEAEEEER